MKPDDIQFLISNRDSAHRLSTGELQNMVRIVNENFNDGYKPDLMCSHCVTNLIRYCYDKFDKMIKE